jgi:hypothetical protein
MFPSNQLAAGARSMRAPRSDVVAVTIEIMGSPAPIPRIPVPWAGPMTVQRVMEAAYNRVQSRSPGSFTFALEYFGTYQAYPLGYMVVMVDGVFDMPDERTFWALKINGTYASRGLDYTHVTDGDVITLTNEAYDSEVHAGTHVEARLQVLQGIARH